MVDVGAGVRNKLLGTARLTVTDSGNVGVFAAWQFSQVVLVGRCEPGPAIVEGGMTTIPVTPKNELLLMVGP
jgi:hypothetical protein